MDITWIPCLLLILGFSGCLGSFMNVVIYRLPQSVPLGKPLWSFCPFCRRSIHWYDNIPVFSYFRLGSRCRYCRTVIPPRYVIIEVLTILTFLILLDVFFVSHLRGGIVNQRLGFIYVFYENWPIYAAHALLFTCLIGMSAIDIQAYWVDIRFTHLAAFFGFALHAIWAPVRVPGWSRPGPTLAGAAIAATIGAIIVHLLVSWYWSRTAEGERDGSGGEDSPAPSDAAASPPAAEQAEASGTAAASGSAAAERTFPFSAWLAGLVLYYTLALLVVALIDQAQASALPLDRPSDAAARAYRLPDAAFATRVVPALVFVFLTMIAAGVIPRPADQEIEEALEAERPQARKVALTELAWLLLPILLFAAGYLLLRDGGPLHEPWQKLWSWHLGRCHPLVGLGTAAVGFVISAALGWTVRIVFTLILGKEAFGSGDIHMMAAAGAVVGWEVVVVGFFLSALLALAGWILTLPFKRGHALPMGPWLTLAIFIVVILREPIIDGYFAPSFGFMLRYWFGVTG